MLGWAGLGGAEAGRVAMDPADLTESAPAAATRWAALDTPALAAEVLRYRAAVRDALVAARGAGVACDSDEELVLECVDEDALAALEGAGLDDAAGGADNDSGACCVCLSCGARRAARAR